MDDILIRPVGKDTVDQQVAVFARSFGFSADGERLKNGWIEKHYRNPAGDSVILGAFSGEKMVGLNAFMPVEYRLNDRILKVVQSCDSGVDPDFRRRGIWGAIIRRAMERFARETSYDAMIGFPNYSNSYPGFLKLGWKSVLSLSNLVMINSGQAIAERYLPKALSPIGNVAALQKIPAKRIAGPMGHYTLETTREFASCPPTREGETLSLRCNRDWMSWKAAYKGFQNYAVRRDGKRVADFVIQEHSVNSLKYLQLIAGCSHADDKTYRAALAALLLSFSGRKDMALIRLMCAHPSQYRALGFVNVRFHRNPFIVYPLRPEWEETLLNPSAWNIGALDLD